EEFIKLYESPGYNAPGPGGMRLPRGYNVDYWVGGMYQSTTRRFGGQQVADFNRDPLTASSKKQHFDRIKQRIDGGMPEENKQFLDVTIKGRTIDSDRDVTVQYRLDETAAWTSLATITSSPTTTTFSAITGRAIQVRLDFNAYTNDVPTEVNEVEVRFRVLPTYKNIYTMLLELEGGSQAGGQEPDVALTALEDLHGAAAVTLIEPGPAQRSKTVSVIGVRQIELSQEGSAMGSMVVEVVAAEA
ncbi:hypothetical protein LCGC14_1907000, partial [marine sediment metagenome]